MSNSKYKILLVDDSRISLEFMEYNLKRKNYHVFTAGNGKEAISVAKGKMDLIILDIMMPEMDGIETCRTLREIPEFRHTLIAFLTAEMRTIHRLPALMLERTITLQNQSSHEFLSAGSMHCFAGTTSSDSDQHANKNILSVGDLQIDREQYLIQKGAKR